MLCTRRAQPQHIQPLDVLQLTPTIAGVCSTRMKFEVDMGDCHPSRRPAIAHLGCQTRRGPCELQHACDNLTDFRVEQEPSVTAVSIRFPPKTAGPTDATPVENI